MTLKLRAAVLLLLYVLFAALLVYLSILIAGRVNEVSRAGEYNFYVRSSTYGEVQR